MFCLIEHNLRLMSNSYVLKFRRFMYRKLFLYNLVLLYSSCLSTSPSGDYVSVTPGAKILTPSATIADGNLRWGKPCNTCLEIDYQQFVVCHDNIKKVPLWSVNTKRSKLGRFNRPLHGKQSIKAKTRLYPFKKLWQKNLFYV
jgi:hypothetical protein